MLEASSNLLFMNLMHFCLNTLEECSMKHSVVCEQYSVGEIQDGLGNLL